MSHADDEDDRRDPVAVQTKFARWLALKSQGVTFNERLVQNRAFHNPNIAVKMLEFVGVNEHGTNFPLAVYDPNDFPVEADYEAIAVTQRERWETESKPNPQIAPPYVQATNRAFVPSKRHQIMMERFYSRDKK